jgi:hypothetical protein
MQDAECRIQNAEFRSGHLSSGSEKFCILHSPF